MTPAEAWEIIRTKLEDERNRTFLPPEEEEALEVLEGHFET